VKISGFENLKIDGVCALTTFATFKQQQKSEPQLPFSNFQIPIFSNCYIANNYPFTLPCE